MTVRCIVRPLDCVPEVSEVGIILDHGSVICRCSNTAGLDTTNEASMKITRVVLRAVTKVDVRPKRICSLIVGCKDWYSEMSGTNADVFVMQFPFRECNFELKLVPQQRSSPWRDAPVALQLMPLAAWLE